MMASINISIPVFTMLLAVVLASNSSREDRGEDPEDDLSKIGGLPTVWWSPIQHGATLPSLLAAGLSSLAIGAAVVSRSPNEAEARHDSFDRVYRGVEARPHSWPWVAKIKTVFTHPGGRKRVRACGGALISDSFVITARHCVSWDGTGEVVEGRRVMLWLGSHLRQGLDGVQVPVRRVLARTDYQAPTCAEGMWCPSWAFWAHSILTNDIALLQLARPVHISQKIQPISLSSSSPSPGTEAWVGGWGLDGRRPSESLQITPMAVQQDSYRECAQQLAPGKLCAVGKDLGGPCPGDSGSPLLVYSSLHGPQLIGIVSNGAESCMGGLPGIFTRVSHYIDWIYLAMERATTGRVRHFHPSQHSLPGHQHSVPRLGRPMLRPAPGGSSLLRPVLPAAGGGGGGRVVPGGGGRKRRFRRKNRLFPFRLPKLFRR